MDEIMNLRIAVTSTILALIPQFSSAHFSIFPENSPVEFLNSLTIGSKNAVISIPSKYQLVDHQVVANKQIISFIPDNDTKDNWKQHISLNISHNTEESASAHIENIRQYFIKNYPNGDMLSSDINRSRDGIQSADISLVYQDEQSDVVLSAYYYSDGSHLIGVEVQQRVKKSVNKTLNETKKIALQAIQLND